MGKFSFFTAALISFSWGEHQRADHRQVLAGEVAHRRKAAEPPLVEQVHDKGLDGVVPVVAQRQLVAAQLLGGVVQGAPAHLGAEAAGVVLVPDLEHYPADVGAADLIGDPLGGKEAGDL